MKYSTVGLFSILLISLLSAAMPSQPSSAWMARNIGLPPIAAVTSILAVDRPAQPRLLLAGIYGPESLYISHDNGLTWRISGQGVDGQPVHMLGQHGRGRVLAGTSTGLYQLDDLDSKGDPLWARVEGWPQRRAVYALAQTPGGESLVAGAWPALLRYDGERARFSTPVVADPGAILSVLALANGTILAGTDGAGLFISTDQGESWQQAAEIGETFVAALQTLPWADGVVLARTRNGLFRSQDHGQSWSPLPLTVDGRPDAFLALPHRRILVVGMSTGQLVASRDNSDTWAVWGGGLPRDGLLHTLTGDAARLWAGSAHGLYVSDDGGESWRLHRDVGTPSLSALAVRADGTLYVGSHDGVYRSTNQGERSDRLDVDPGRLGRYSAARRHHRLGGKRAALCARRL